jgi:hypothetical protein
MGGIDRRIRGALPLGELYKKVNGSAAANASYPTTSIRAGGLTAAAYETRVCSVHLQLAASFQRYVGPVRDTLTATIANKPQKFHGNYLNWVVDRPDRTFRVFVIEPDYYEPKMHATIFDAALSALVEWPTQLFDSFTKPQQTIGPEHFDLATFPEAFLPAERLLGVLSEATQLPSLGCVHVGLRPCEERHLFQVDELQKFVKAIIGVPGVESEDLSEFSNWLSLQNLAHNFNIGCLFTVDTERKLRVCLHPKLVRSKWEVSTLVENHMTEANLLTLVTLHPADKLLKTVTIQPLLCSDALDLATDRGECGPLQGVNSEAATLSENPPDHIDIVSIATCTPQKEIRSEKGESHLVWHQEFRSSFVRAASSDALARHHYATFVLANFRTLEHNKPAGLSGAFLPVKLRDDTYAKYITISCYGRLNAQRENSWSPPDEGYVTAIKWQNRAYLAYLDRLNDRRVPTCRMFGFTVHRLPRDLTIWDEETGLTKCTQLIAEYRGDPVRLVFSAEVQHA